MNVKYWCLFVGTFILQSSVFSHWFYSTVPNDKREEKKIPVTHTPWRKQLQILTSRLRPTARSARLVSYSTASIWGNLFLSFFFFYGFFNQFIIILELIKVILLNYSLFIMLKETMWQSSAAKWCALKISALATRWGSTYLNHHLW